MSCSWRRRSALARLCSLSPVVWLTCCCSSVPYHGEIDNSDSDVLRFKRLHGTNYFWSYRLVPCLLFLLWHLFFVPPKNVLSVKTMCSHCSVLLSVSQTRRLTVPDPIFFKFLQMNIFMMEYQNVCCRSDFSLVACCLSIKACFCLFIFTDRIWWLCDAWVYLLLIFLCHVVLFKTCYITLPRMFLFSDTSFRISLFV